MIDAIKPPKPPEKVYVAFEMLDTTLADWLLNMTVVDRETILFEAYIKHNLDKIHKDKLEEKHE